ncbi:YkvI family membrane protein [Desulfolucanica intricata]|uniref:YkvI family membrane protein n=1 Tax=Desulfolucanica intricata TaxID=1285191 RepID=UPI0008337B5C|nr:hypothetical protein [Desulfolucanica intricata]
MIRSKNSIILLIKTTSLYIGAVIGAGFASGQEILQFFVSHGWLGIWGIVVATMLFSYLGALVLFLAVKYQTSGYQDLLPYVLGKFGFKILDVLSLLMLIGGLGVMFAGSGAIFSEHLGLSSKVGITAALCITVIVILGGLKRVLAANVILVPLKLLAVTVISILAIFNRCGVSYNVLEITYTNNFVSNWFLAGILYVSYNMIVSLAVLSTLGKNINTRIGIVSGIWGGLILGLSAGFIALAELSYYPEITEYEIPLLYIANQLGSKFHYGFGFLVWMAMITTAIANVHGFVSRFTVQNSKSYKTLGVIVCLFVLPLTVFNFGELVKIIYPLFGYAGLVILLALLVFPGYSLLKR